MSDKVSFLHSYKFVTVNNPQPGVFNLIQKSYLPGLLAGGGVGVAGCPSAMDGVRPCSAPARMPAERAAAAGSGPAHDSGWPPIGETAASVLSDGASGGALAVAATGVQPCLVEGKV